MQYILHLYHPSGPCKRMLFHSPVAARQEAFRWLTTHFPDKRSQYFRDITAQTDYFNPVFLAPVEDNIPATARYLVRLGSDVHYPESESQAWQLINSYAATQHLPTAQLDALHAQLKEQAYEPALQILFYPITWGD